jgi:hypothetical protein
MCDLVNAMHKSHKHYVQMNIILERYEMPFNEMTGEEIVYAVAEKNYQGNVISSSDRLLGDFRKGMLGLVSLESPPPYLKQTPTSSSKKGKDSTEQQLDSHASRNKDIMTVKRRRQEDAGSGGDAYGDEEEDDNEAEGDDGDTVGDGEGQAKREGGVSVVGEKKRNLATSSSSSSSSSSAQPPLPKPRSSLDIGRGNYDGW